jgi:biopolymer transport protein ExbB/TolQ
MNIQTIENLMYQMSDLFLAPVLVLLMVLFAYSLFAIGSFSFQLFQRHHYKNAYEKAIDNPVATDEELHGYPLTEMFAASLKGVSGKKSLVGKNPQATMLNQDQLDVAALKELEMVRTVSRLAPMLGLIATMVPMGPALKSLADGNVQGISDNLIVAFSAVIFGLVIASITFWIATIKKRWLATELVDLLPHLNAIQNMDGKSGNAVVLENDCEAA